MRNVEEETWGPADAYFTAWDPGETSGFCAWNKWGIELDYCNVGDDVTGFYKFSKRFKEKPPAVAIVEEYFITPMEADLHRGSRVETVRVIGAINYWCLDNEIDFILADRNDKKETAKQFGITIPTSNHHKWHYIDARLHGLKYLNDRKIVKNVLEQMLADGKL